MVAPTYDKEKSFFLTIYPKICYNTTKIINNIKGIKFMNKKITCMAILFLGAFSFTGCNIFDKNLDKYKEKMTETEQVTVEDITVIEETTVAEITIETTTETTVSEKIDTETEADKTENEAEEKEEITESEKVEKSINYSEYYNVLNSAIDSISGNSFMAYQEYYIYDINHDGIYELLTHQGTCEADAMLSIYSIDNDGHAVFIDIVGGGHMCLVEQDGELYSNWAHMGYHYVNKILLNGSDGNWIVEHEEVLSEENIDDYTEFGTYLEGYDYYDQSGIDALCSGTYAK